MSGMYDGYGLLPSRLERKFVQPRNRLDEIEARAWAKTHGYVAEAYLSPHGVLYRNAKHYGEYRAEGLVTAPPLYRVRVKLKRG